MFKYFVEAMCGSREGFWGGGEGEGPDSQTPPLKNSNSLNLHTLNTENMPATPPPKKTLTNLDPRIGAINYCVYEEYKVCPKIKTLRSARHRKKTRVD